MQYNACGEIAGITYKVFIYYWAPAQNQTIVMVENYGLSKENVVQI